MFEQSALNTIDATIISLILFILFIAVCRLGFLIKEKAVNKKGLKEKEGLAALEGSLLGLLALLLAFTFGMSSSRHSRRLDVIVAEANHISTAILRADLYPDSMRNAFRKDFRAYVENRIAFYEAGTDIEKITANFEQGEKLQSVIWERATGWGRIRDNMHQTSQMIPALNNMIDITTTRNAVNLDKVPDIIIYLLMTICITSAFMVGFSSATKPGWVMMTVFSAMISLTVYMIIDLDRPRKGLITMDNANHQIVRLRELFKSESQ